MSVEWDPAKAASNLQKHGVSFSDAELVLRDPYGVSVEDESAEGEERYVVVGARRHHGRMLHLPR